MTYKLYRANGSEEPNAVKTVGVEPQVSFILDPDNVENTAYRSYLAWIAEGNEPLPAD